MKVNEILSEETAKPSFDGKYPIALKAISAIPVYSREVTRFEKLIPIIQSCIEAGEIVSTQLDDVKYAMNAFVDAAFKTAISEKHTYAGQFQSQHPDMAHMDLPGSPREIPTLIKRLAKVPAGAKATAMWKETSALAEELLELTKVDAWLKDHKIMASVKKKQLSDAKASAEGEYQKKYTDHKDTMKVTALLKKTAADIEDKVYKSTLKSLVALVELYKEKCVDGVTDYNKIFEKDPYRRTIIQSLVERLPTDYKDQNRTIQYKLEKGYKETLEKMAKRNASDIIDHFVSKNSGKLSFIMYNKNNLKTVEIQRVEVQRGAVECDVVCEFKDGSSFIANSSIVYAISKLGKWFYRYPTLFRNVYMPDGSRMSAPTEKKMDEVFALTK